MPTRTRKDLEQSLKQGQIEPVYFLYGSEVYLRDQTIRLITDTALTGTLLREFNDSSFNLLTNDVRDAIAVAEQLPMMSGRRVIRLRNFAKLREADEEFLLKYLERPVETSVVIFIGDDIDKRKKLGKKLLAGGASPNEIFSEVRVPSFKQRAYLSMLSRIDSKTMAGMIQRIAETDLAIKTSKATPRMQMEMLVCELMI